MIKQVKHNKQNCNIKMVVLQNMKTQDLVVIANVAAGFLYFLNVLLHGQIYLLYVALVKSQLLSTTIFRYMITFKRL